MKKLFFLLIACLLTLAGCNKQETPVFSGVEAGTIDSGIFTSDSGTKMYVTGNELKYDINRSRRVVIEYETLSVSDPDHIEIDLQGLMEAIIREPSSVGEMADQPEGSPVQITDAWFSGGYLNLLFSCEGKEYDKHQFSTTYLVNKDKIVIRLLHESSENVNNSIINAFLSIPMQEPELSFYQFALSLGKKDGIFPAPVLLQWTALTIEGGPLALYEMEGSYNPPASEN